MIIFDANHKRTELPGLPHNNNIFESNVFVMGKIWTFCESLSGIQDSLVIAVNQNYIERDSLIDFRGGEEVAVIPPISGG